MNKLEPCVLSFKFVGRRVVDKISVHDVGRPELVFSIPIRFTRASFARQWHLLIKMYDMVGALHGCRSVKVDS